MNRLKTSIILNIINVIFIIFATIVMLCDFHFMTESNILDFPGVNDFQFFTVDSNILLGIASIVFIVYEILVIKNKEQDIPRWVRLFKYVATVATSLTMIIVVLFLGPVAPTGYFSLFVNGNLFFHFLCPLLGMITLLCFENSKAYKFKELFLGLLPTVIYGTYYLINVLVHMENGVVNSEYDWYGFAQGGVPSIIFSIVLMLISTLLIAIGLYFGNKHLFKTKE